MARRKSTTAAPEVEKATVQKTQDQVALVGRLCADPVLRHTKSGKAVATIRVAVNSPEGEATFHSVVVWGRTAEVICAYLRKGRRVEVAGRSQERTYTVGNGTERTVTEIAAFRVTFLSGRGADIEEAKA